MNRQVYFVGFFPGLPRLCWTVTSSKCSCLYNASSQGQGSRRVSSKIVSPQLVMLAAHQGNGAETHRVQHRIATVHRKTNETEVSVTVNLDGTGKCNVSTGIGFLDHMLHQISSHGLIDLEVKAVGDYHIDDHHTNEDVGITIGMAIVKALGSKKGIRRFGHFVAPLDEALVEVVMDFSGRPWIEYGLVIPTEKVGMFDTQLVREFYSAIAANAQLTLHIRQHNGINSHHIIEASFKAFARAMRMALEIDPRRMDSVPSSKGVLTDQQGLDEARKEKIGDRAYSDKPFRLRRRRYKPKMRNSEDGVGVSDSSEMNMEV